MRDAWLRSSPLGLGLAGAVALWLAFPNGWISLPPLALLLPLTFNPSIVLMLQLSDLRARCQPLDQRFDNLWGRL